MRCRKARTAEQKHGTESRGAITEKHEQKNRTRKLGQQEQQQHRISSRSRIAMQRNKSRKAAAKTKPWSGDWDSIHMT